jgi:carotenoid cleavage dioxygenase
MLFAPLDAFFEKKIREHREAKGLNKRPNPILAGNFGPIKEEQSYEVAKIVGGKVPEDINGFYLRNGPDPKHMPDNGCHHWFDGDAMIHAMRIKKG